MFASRQGILETAAPLPACMRVSDAPAIDQHTFCSIRLEQNIRPKWLPQEYEMRLPVAGLRAADGDSEILAWVIIKGRQRPLISGVPGEAVILHFDPRATFENILFEEYASAAPPFLARLPMDYHRIPGPLRGAAARAITLAGRVAARSATNVFPCFPMEKSVEALDAALRLCVSEIDQQPDLRVLLTHDVDEAGALAGIPAIARAEQSRGLHSLWFMAGKLFGKHQSRIQDLKDTGHEIGLHGIRHDMKFPYLRPDRMRAQLEPLKIYMEQFAIRGFRSPYYLRTPAMFQVLSDYVAFDSSVPDTDRFSLGPNPGGCCVTRAFRREGLIELPVTLPFEIPWMSGVPAGKLVALWQHKVRFVRDAGGLLVVNTHPDAHVSGRPDMHEAYCEFLDYLIDQGARFVMAGDIVR